MERREALQQAIDEISRQRAEILRLRQGAREPIAIVGMACRFPAAPTVDDFWTLLARGGDAVSRVPDDRWNADAYYDPDPSAVGKMATKYGGFIRDVDRFDPQFFGIAPREAQSMDPQQRLLLEVTWEALEHATIAPADLHGSATGVFVGITCFDHAIRISQATENFNAYAGTGSALNMAPGRLSYVLGLMGPSLAIDTACSSSLVGLHLACQSLRARETDMALVGGVHLILSPEVMVSFSQARMLAADGRSKTFDASADGYSRGEGCGVVVLKRLADAVAHGDRILGVVRGTAVNQDGPSTGLTVPSGTSQQQVIRRALDAAGLSPEAVSYVETHGTGTPLGDPIEVEALAKVYGQGRTVEDPLLIGSVKTNIGHLEPAAGMAGLIKLLLAFEHSEIPRHLHFQTPNSHIPWDTVPVRVAADAVAWPPASQPRTAGLSAFGFSGTNAHVIIEEPPVAASTEHSVSRNDSSTSATDRLCLLPISARSEAALNALAVRYIDLLATVPDDGLAAVAYTAGVGRSHMPHRLVVLATTIDEAREALQAFATNQPSSALHAGQAANADYRRDGAAVSARLERAYAHIGDVCANHRDALTDVASLYLEGVAVDWDRLCGATGVPSRVGLPLYPFQRQRYWVDTVERGTSAPVMPSRYQTIWTSLGPAATNLESCRARQWAIVPGDPELAAGLRDLLAEHGAAPAAPPTDIVFIGGASSADDAGEGCAALLALIQELVGTPGAAPRIWVVTRGAIPATTKMTLVGASQAPLAAMARVLGLEHPELFGRLIDLDSTSRTTDAAVLLGEILHEDAEDQIALRDDQRYAPRLDRVTEPWPEAEPLRGDATYLITGGLGRIGLQVARDLAVRGAKHLCLLGRSGVTTSDQQAGVATIEAHGATVRVVAADVADQAAMTAVIGDLAGGPPLAGVVHAAGLPGYTDLAHLDPTELASVLRPKIQGGWILHELVRELPLDFFVCFSSIASAWGSRGQAHYAAANGFLDALAHLRRAAGLRSVTINWGPWVEGGMTSPEAATLLSRVGIRPLPTHQATAAFAALAQADRPQVVVADIDWTLFKGSYEARGHRPLLERIVDGDGTVAEPVSGEALALVRHVRAAAAPERERLLREVVQREVAQVLALAAPASADVEQGLFEMGMDSLMALELRTRLQTLVSRALPATLVFDHPTIQAIARFLVGELVGLADEPLKPLSAPSLTSFDAKPDTDFATDFDAFSDEEAEAALLKKLESIR